MWQACLGVVGLVFGSAIALFVGQTNVELPPPIPPGTHEVVILHTNDLHGQTSAWRGWDGELLDKEVGGIASVASAVKRVRSQVGAGRTLLVDAGGSVTGAMLSDLTHGRAMLDAMDAMGYSVVTPGDDPAEFNRARLAGREKKYRFRTVAANVYQDPGNQLLLPPFTIEKAGNVQIGFIGLVNPHTSLFHPRGEYRGVRIEPDPALSVRRLLPTMYREGAQVIVVLSHMGLAADRKLAREVPEVTAIIGGYSHNRISEAQLVNNTIIVQAGAYGSDLGRLDLIYRDGKLQRYQHQLTPIVVSAYRPDPQVAGIVDAHSKDHLEAMTRPLARTRKAIVRAQAIGLEEPILRNQQSPADSLIADAIRESTAADVALLPNSGRGVAIREGPITAADLWSLVPRDRYVTLVTLTGAQIREVLEQAVFNVHTEDPYQRVGGVLQVSGMTYSFDPRAAKGAAVQEIRIGGRPIGPTDKYLVATDSALAAGDERMATFKSGLLPKRVEESQFELVRDWLREKGEISPPEDVRIRAVMR